MAYDASSIQVLEWWEAVRRRPAMYIGGVDEEGVRHLVWEVVANALDQHLGRRASRVRVDLDPVTGWVEIEDDGPGVPVEPHPRHGRPFVEIVLTNFGMWPTFDGHFPHVHLSRRGVGLGPVNALSEAFEIEVRRTWIACEALLIL